MNKKDDNTITYIACKVMILLILLICIFNASAISRVIFLPHYTEIEYSDFTIITSYITAQILFSLLSVLDIGLIVVDYLNLSKNS